MAGEHPTSSVRAVEHEPPGAAKRGQGDWPRLRWVERLPVILTLLVVTAVMIPRLPDGICFDDAGDLQLASTTLGIMHSPGYAGYVTLGYVLTRIPGVDPAYIISLGCLASGIAALLFCILMQVRLGVNAWVASAWSLVLLAHSRVWANLIAPEVYAPSLMFLVAAAYVLLKYVRLGARRHLLIAALLFGVALANRPPVLFTLPFFLIAWWFARRKWERSWRQSAVSLSLAAGCAALPGLEVVGYLWLRDRPDAAYNYIEQFDHQWDNLPDAGEGWKAKMQRIVWHVSGAQFKYLMGNTWPGVRQRLNWLRYELFSYSSDPILMVIVLLAAFGLIITFRRRITAARLLAGAALAAAGLVILHYRSDNLFDLMFIVTSGTLRLGTVLIVIAGLVVTFRRCPAGAILLLGMAIASVVFICVYRVYGQSGDILPLLFAGTVFSGVGLWPLIARRNDQVQWIIAVCGLLLMCIVTVVDAPHRRPTSARLDASRYVRELDMATLPPDAVICTGWREWPPLRYAQYVLDDRPDIYILNADPRNWLRMIAGMTDRPVFFTRNFREVKHLKLTRYRNVWRLDAKSLPPGHFKHRAG